VEDRAHIISIEIAMVGGDSGSDNLKVGIRGVEPTHSHEGQHLVTVWIALTAAKHLLKPRSNLSDVMQEARPGHQVPQIRAMTQLVKERIASAPLGKTFHDLAGMRGERFSWLGRVGRTLGPYLA